jgi:hypothetical protein
MRLVMMIDLPLLFRSELCFPSLLFYADLFSLFSSNRYHFLVLCLVLAFDHSSNCYARIILTDRLVTLLTLM